MRANVLLLLLVAAVPLAGSQSGPASVVEKRAVLDVVEELFGLPQFIERLAVEAEDQLDSESGIRTRLEAAVAAIFAEDELIRRLRFVRSGSHHHTWSDWFGDLSGAPFSAGVLTFPEPARAVFQTRRNTVEQLNLVEPAAVVSLYQRYPEMNVSQADVLERLRRSPAGELAVQITALQDVTVQLRRTPVGWRVVNLTFRPVMAVVHVIAQ